VVESKNKIIELHGELQNAKKIQEAKRNLFLKADAEFKSLEKLKTMQKAEHSRNQLKKEENEIDDIIGSRFAYNLNPPLS
jgi:flagellar export protein FliJ